MKKDNMQSIRIWKSTYIKLKRLVQLIENSSQVRVFDDLVTKELKKLNKIKKGE